MTDGFVKPAFEWRPPAARTLTRELTALAERFGRPLYPEQVYALDVLTGLRADGGPAADMAAIVCGRQNMKTWLLELIALGRLLMPGGDRYSVWSAHEVATSQETYNDILVLADDHAWFARHIESTSKSNGKESITFRGRRKLRFRARRRTGGRGLSGDSVFLDEGFALVPEHMQALLPILSTRPRSAAFVGSSAGLPQSSVLRGLRDRGRRGGPRAPAYIEWCAPGSFAAPGCAAGVECLHEIGTAGCVVDDEASWVWANPGLPRGRVILSKVRSERDEMTPRGFAVERLGWWDDPDTTAVDLAAWSSLADPGSRPTGRPVLGLDVSPGLRSAAIVAAGRRGDGAAHVEVLEYRAGTDWVAPWLAASTAARGAAVYVLAGSGQPVAALMPDLTRVRTVEVSAAGFSAACGSAQRLVDDRGVRHLGSPVLAAALAGAVRRDVGDGGWVMSRKKSGPDISPAVAMVLALWGLAERPTYSISDSVL